MNKFQLQSSFKPKGDQVKAIEELVQGSGKYQQQTLLGVTGSGKTFTMANVIATLNKPTLVLVHNKTLAAQLYNEFSAFFPDNKVCYFVSYYDYYQPESYIPQTDTYIEKDTQINEKIERLRLDAASALLTRSDVIIVASVSCIYGFGQPQDFEGESILIKVQSSKFKVQSIQGPQDLARRLVQLQYERNDIELRSGRFRIRGNTLDVVQGSGTTVLRIRFGEEGIDKILELDPFQGKVIRELDQLTLFPAKPFIIPKERQKRAIDSISKELKTYLPTLGQLEAYRLKQRTLYDIEMIEQLGYCKGIENYSRHFDMRLPGSHPFTLLDFFQYKFQSDWLMFIDESHVTLPQVRGMYEGDRSRKKNLIEYGFRLPSALDNRPLKFEEFKDYLHHVIYVSATPADYELQHSDQIVEQIIRPTGLVDPKILVRPIQGQIDHCIHEIRRVAKNGYRTLVVTLTKRMAEDIALYLKEEGIRSEYLHSEIDTLERNEIIRKLRLGQFDVLVGINLLREGLDLPEVALVAVLDADKEGFLRNSTSLIQTIGRAARNIHSRVILYADTMTQSMEKAIQETNRRRNIQLEYNKRHHITPKSIVKAIAEEDVVIEPDESADEREMDTIVIDLELQMQHEAENLNFEKAIILRDQIKKIKSKLKIVTS